MNEKPNCNFCQSPPEVHTLIFSNVQEKETNLVQCDNCGLRFFSPRPTWEWIMQNIWTESNAGMADVAKNCYENGLLVGEPKNAEVQKANIQNYYRHLFAKVKDNNNNAIPSSILEIGCNVGWFLKLCRDQGVQQLFGAEINYEAVKIANNEMGLPNVNQSDFGSYQGELTYDWVVMLDYLEHSYVPFDNLKLAYDLVVPNGLLVIKTFLEELDPEHKMMSPPFHAHHFFGHVLYKMITDVGFTILRWDIENDQVFVVAKREEK